MRLPITQVAAIATLMCLCTVSYSQENCGHGIDNLINDHVEALVRFKLKSAIPGPIPGMSEAELNQIKEESRRKMQLQPLKAQYCRLLLENLSPEERESLLTFASTPSGAKALRQFAVGTGPLHGALDVEILTSTTSSFVEAVQKRKPSQ